MEKKGVELTMNTIIVAALSLLVLIVLAIIFSGGFGDVMSKLLHIKSVYTDREQCIVTPGDPADTNGDGYKDNDKYKVTCPSGSTTNDVPCDCKDEPSVCLKNCQKKK
jgi:hypothetical protein